MNNEDAVGGFQFDLTGVTVTGTPGTDGATTITVSNSTPSILYYYCTALLY